MLQSLPKFGCSRERLIQQVVAAQKDDMDWRKGRVFGIVYYLNEELLQISTEVYNWFLSESASKPLVWPSIRKFENEIISMASDLFHGSENMAGTVTSGGTESIFLAVKSGRDWARSNRTIPKSPEIIAPMSAHPGFDRSAELLGLEVIRIPVTSNFAADIEAMADAISDNTVMIVASAPSYPHGVMDPIKELGNVAEEKGLWFHVDACHGFLTPFIKKLGYSVNELGVSANS